MDISFVIIISTVFVMMREVTWYDSVEKTSITSSFGNPSDHNDSINPR